MQIKVNQEKNDLEESLSVVEKAQEVPGEEIPDALMFKTLESFNDILKKSRADNPMLKEKEELLKCLNDYKLELDYRTELVKQGRTNKEQTESNMKKYIIETSGMITDIENIYDGVENKYRSDDGYYKEKGYEDSPILKYTVLLCINSNYYDTIGLLAIHFINEEDYKKGKAKP